MNIEDIEDRVRETKARSVLVIMSSYSGETSGSNYEFLFRATDYHHHSGPLTDLFCAGYSLYEPSPSIEANTAIKLPQTCWPLAYFYPHVFHSIRQFVVRALQSKWNYKGGIDALLFATTGDKGRPIDWSHAAVVQSRKHVGRSFGDVDEMLRTLINLNEEFEGKLVPDLLNPVMNRKLLADRAKAVAKILGGSALGAAVKFVG